MVDEAHRMSAHYFGQELKTTKRYQLGLLLGRITHHLLLMTATPHAGKLDDFQLFLALLDGDRFEGRYRDGVEVVIVVGSGSDPRAAARLGACDWHREEFGQAVTMTLDTPKRLALAD